MSTKQLRKHRARMTKPGRTWRVIHEVDGQRKQAWIRTKRKHLKAVTKALGLKVVRIEPGWHFDFLLSPV